MALCSVEMTSGVVVDVGHGVATCCAVWEGEERPGSIAQDPLKCTAFVLAEMVNSVLASCTEEMRSVLRERVVLTGKTLSLHAHVLYILYHHLMHMSMIASSPGSPSRAHVII